MADLYVAEIRAYDLATAGLVVLRYATEGFVTQPTETPPNAYFDGKLKQPVLLKRDLFSAGTTSGRSRVSFGDLVLVNEDGALDALLGYGFDGRSVIVRRGTVGAAYPSGFTTIFDGTAEQVEAAQSAILIKVRDNQLALEIPIQATKYAGDNALPDGLEGGPDDLKGKPKPRCLGAVLNVSPPCVNTSKLIYQVNDGPVASVSAVYDNGIALGDYLAIMGAGQANYAILSASGVEWGDRGPVSVFGGAVIPVTCLAFGAGLVVAGSTGGRISTSPDGVVWTARTNPFGGGQVVGIASSGTGFVAVGSGPMMATSADGITWSAVADLTPLGGNTPLCVTYGLGLFVVAGVGGVLVTSSDDGATWTSRTSSFAGTTIRGLANDGTTLFVAVGDSGKVATSPNGTAWTQRTSGLSNSIYAVAWGSNDLQPDGLFVATGDSNQVGTSPDGVTWTARALPGTLAAFYTAGFFPGGETGLFVVGGERNRAAWSLDGEAWTFAPTPQAIGGGITSFTSFAAGIVSPVTYADVDELLDDDLAPAPGQAKAYLAGGYIRLGSTPAGQVAADVTAGAAAADRTAGQMFARLLTDPLGAPLQEYSSADVAALDLAIDAVLGLWTGTEEMTVAAALDLIAQSVGAWWGANRLGVMRIQQFTAPSGSPLIDFTANQLLKALERVPVNDASRGLPVWRSIVRYGRNWTPQTSGVASGVTAVRRAFLALEWRDAKAEDSTVQLAHPLAPQTLEDSLLLSEGDAQAEATRRQTLRGVLRDRYNIVVPLDDDTETLDLGDVVSLTHPRYALTGGPSFRVLGIDPDAQKRQLSSVIWK